MKYDPLRADSAFASVFSLLIFVTLLSLLLGWLVQPNHVAATALFQVDSLLPISFNDNSTRAMGEREYSIHKQTQIALLKSEYVLAAAIRNPSIASLPIFHGKADPIAWLQNNLDVKYQQDSQILSITLHGTEAQTADLVQVVDAVVKAYQSEVIGETRQRRLANRDLLSRNLDNLNSEMKRKLEDYLDVARESGRGDADGQVLQDVAVKRLDRIEAEVMRLESETATLPLKGDEDKRKPLEQRIAQLRQQQTEVESNIKKSAERSSDLEFRHEDLEQLQRISRDLSLKLEELDIEATAPDQIRQLQPAISSRE